MVVQIASSNKLCQCLDTCTECHGSGNVGRDCASICPTCAGEGQAHNPKCQVCHGTGKARQDAALDYCYECNRTVLTVLIEEPKPPLSR